MQKDESEINDDVKSMLYVNFNQDGSCFAVGTQNGFRIINSCPFKNHFYRDMNGGIGVIEMLYRSNIVALIGGGKSPRYAENKLVIWDDHKAKEISEMRFMSKVRNVKMKRDKIFVVCDDKIYVFNFNTLELLDTLETCYNGKGIISISIKGNTIVAYPDKTTLGTVQIKDYDKQSEISINAHKGPIYCLQLNKEGSILATASDKGTLIRLFNTSNGNLIRELRRGAENAEIFSIAFDNNNKFLAVSSDRKTIHIFNIVDEETEEKKENDANAHNKKSVLWNISKFFGVGKDYFGGEWSFARFKIDSPKSICTFGPDNSIIVVTKDGKYYQATFDPKNGGECTKTQEKNII